MDVLQELLELLKLEKIEENIFRGQSQDLGFGNIFGGQVLGQALSAASQTVSPERRAHSLHAYFMRPGDPKMPIVYDVDCIRDGKSFTTRRVVASNLSSYHCFVQRPSGGDTWVFDERKVSQGRKKAKRRYARR